MFGGEAPRFLRYRDLGTTGKDADLVAHVALKFGDEIAVMGSDASTAIAWSELFGACVDRFGVRWIVDYEGTVQFAMP